MDTIYKWFHAEWYHVHLSFEIFKAILARNYVTSVKNNILEGPTREASSFIRPAV